MQLEDEIGPLRDELRRALAVEPLRPEAGIELAEDVVPLFHRVAADDVALRLVLVGLAGHRSFHPFRSRRPDPNFAVVQHLRVTRPHFGGHHPHVFLEVGLHHHVLVVDGAARRHFERLRHLHDYIGRDVPAGWEHAFRRGGRRVARRGAGVGPARQRVELVGAQHPFLLVGVVLEPGFGKPRRHRLRLRRLLDPERPRPRLLVGEERHRRHLAGPVAGLAVRLEDGQDVLVEGRRLTSRSYGCAKQRTHDGNE